MFDKDLFFPSRKSLQPSRALNQKSPRIPAPVVMSIDNFFTLVNKTDFVDENKKRHKKSSDSRDEVIFSIPNIEIEKAETTSMSQRIPYSQQEQFNLTIKIACIGNMLDGKATDKHNVLLRVLKYLWCEHWEGIIAKLGKSKFSESKSSSETREKIDIVVGFGLLKQLSELFSEWKSHVKALKGSSLVRDLTNLEDSITNDLLYDVDINDKNYRRLRIQFSFEEIEKRSQSVAIINAKIRNAELRFQIHCIVSQIESEKETVDETLKKIITNLTQLQSNTTLDNKERQDLLKEIFTSFKVCQNKYGTFTFSQFLAILPGKGVYPNEAELKDITISLIIRTSDRKPISTDIFSVSNYGGLFNKDEMYYIQKTVLMSEAIRERSWRNAYCHYQDRNELKSADLNIKEKLSRCLNIDSENLEILKGFDEIEKAFQQEPFSKNALSNYSLICSICSTLKKLRSPEQSSQRNDLISQLSKLTLNYFARQIPKIEFRVFFLYIKHMDPEMIYDQTITIEEYLKFCNVIKEHKSVELTSDIIDRNTIPITFLKIQDLSDFLTARLQVDRDSLTQKGVNFKGILANLLKDPTQEIVAKLKNIPGLIDKETLWDILFGLLADKGFQKSREDLKCYLNFCDKCAKSQVAINFGSLYELEYLDLPKLMEAYVGVFASDSMTGDDSSVSEESNDSVVKEAMNKLLAKLELISYVDIEKLISLIKKLGKIYKHYSFTQSHDDILNLIQVFIRQLATSLIKEGANLEPVSQVLINFLMEIYISNPDACGPELKILLAISERTRHGVNWGEVLAAQSSSDIPEKNKKKPIKHTIIEITHRIRTLEAQARRLENSGIFDLRKKESRNWTENFDFQELKRWEEEQIKEVEEYMSEIEKDKKNNHQYNGFCKAYQKAHEKVLNRALKRAQTWEDMLKSTNTRIVDYRKAIEDYKKNREDFIRDRYMIGRQYRKPIWKHLKDMFPPYLFKELTSKKIRLDRDEILKKESDRHEKVIEKFNQIAEAKYAYIRRIIPSYESMLAELLAQLFQYQALDLSEINLGDVSPQDLNIIFSQIPENVQHINLQRTGLSNMGWYEIAELANIIKKWDRERRERQSDSKGELSGNSVSESFPKFLPSITLDISENALKVSQEKWWQKALDGVVNLICVATIAPAITHKMMHGNFFVKCFREDTLVDHFPKSRAEVASQRIILKA